jgi:hypothetical protein
MRLTGVVSQCPARESYPRPTDSVINVNRRRIGVVMVLLPEGKSVLELAQMCASILLPIISVCAVLVAVWAIIANRRTQREQIARNAYIKYIERALQNPEFAFPDWSKINLDAQSFQLTDNPDDGKRHFEKYEWFLSIMLNTSNFVFTSVPANHPLGKQMRLQFAYHWRYIEKFKMSKII